MLYFAQPKNDGNPRGHHVLPVGESHKSFPRYASGYYQSPICPRRSFRRSPPNGSQNCSVASYVKMEGRTARLPEPGGNGKPTSGAVCTVVHGDADLIDMARLYLRPGAVIYDVTVGQSVFWQTWTCALQVLRHRPRHEAAVDLRKLPYGDCPVGRLPDRRPNETRNPRLL